MTFISDGTRTWDPDRGLELKSLGGLRIKSLEISGPAGSSRFEAEWSAYHVEQSQRLPDGENQAANTVIQWDINIHYAIPGFSNDETLDIIREAMKSYETVYGSDSKNGHTPRDVVCRFSGRIV